MSHFITCRSNADATIRRDECTANELGTEFNVLFSTCEILMVFTRYPSVASFVVTSIVCSDGVVFTDILLGTCYSVMLVCSSLTSRGSHFVVIFLLLSVPDDLKCSALCSSACVPFVTTSSPASLLVFVRVTSCLGPVLTNLVSSPMPMFWSVLGTVSWVLLAVVLCQCALGADDRP